MRNLSNFIPGEQVNAVALWRFGDVDGNADAEVAKLAESARNQKLQVDKARDEALRHEGHLQGYAEGFAQGQAGAVLQSERQLREYMDNQGQHAARRFAGLLASAHEQLAQSQQVMAHGVLELACELARQVLRHELSVNPNALQPVIREALALLADDSKGAVVRLNPVDLEVLQETVQGEFATLSLTLTPDASIEPGGCVISSAGAVIDGQLRTRWRRAVAKLGLDVQWDD